MVTVSHCHITSKCIKCDTYLRTTGHMDTMSYGKGAVTTTWHDHKVWKETKRSILTSYKAATLEIFRQSHSEPIQQIKHTGFILEYIFHRKKIKKLHYTNVQM